MTEPTPEEIADAAWASLWGQPERVPLEDDKAFLYWECYPDAKALMGVHRAVGYIGPRPVAVVTSRWSWGLVWKMLKADVRAYNDHKARMSDG